MFFRQKLKEKNAQTMIEFALCIPLIITTLGILIGCTQMVYMRQVTNNVVAYAASAFVNDLNNCQDGQGKLTKKNIKPLILPMIKSAGFNIKYVDFNVQNNNINYLPDGSTSPIASMSNIDGVPKWADCSLTTKCATLMPFFDNSELTCTEHIVVLKYAHNPNGLVDSYPD